MLNLVLPKIEADAQARNYGRFVIGPLESGYGITLGNALRRVLLSSLEGAAITSLQVRGIHHEFSTIPHVREDMTSLLLNLKQVRFKFSDEVEDQARLRLEVQGAGVVTAGDIVCPPIVEVVNPELYLADHRFGRGRPGDGDDRRQGAGLFAGRGAGQAACGRDPDRCHL